MKRIVEIDPKLKTRNVDTLLELPISIRVSEFNNETAKEFAEQISKAHNTGQPVIPVFIDTYGGQIYSLLSMISEIRNSRLPVATIAVGKSMSCGSVLLTCGAPGMRFIDPNAHVMIHDPSSGSYGKTEEVKASAQQLERLETQIFEIMAENCKQPRDYFKKLIHDKSHSEWYLNAKECKKHKLVDHIRVPHFSVKVSATIDFV